MEKRITLGTMRSISINETEQLKMFPELCRQYTSLTQFQKFKMLPKHPLSKTVQKEQATN